MTKTTIKLNSTDKNENGITNWYDIDGVDFGTGYIFENNQYGIVWTANQYVIVDSESCPVTDGDHEWIAVKNAFVNDGTLTK